MKPLSLYIHIPFCKSKCLYCDFLSFAGQEGKMASYVDALVEEIRSHGENVKDRKVISIFVGGGTPSILPAEFIGRIMREVYKNFNVEDGAEISIECNPGSLTKEKVEGYKASGINRVSMGLQSADDNQLKKLGRIHTFEEFSRNYRMLREAGIENINIDLMFGLSHQTMDGWMQTLEQVINLQPEHISVYGLLIEEGTPFYQQNEKNLLSLPNEEQERDMYWQANHKLQENNYEHYEISNYSKKGFECKHNKVYWELGDYIGIGIGAASYFEGVRIENISSLNDYIKALGDLESIIKSRHTSLISEKKEEFVFLGLRLIMGISKQEYVNQFNETIEVDYEAIVKKLVKDGLLVNEKGYLKLSPYGIDISNYVFTQFLQG